MEKAAEFTSIFTNITDFYRFFGLSWETNARLSDEIPYFQPTFPTFTYLSSESGTRIPSNDLVLIDMYQDHPTRLSVLSQESQKNR